MSLANKFPGLAAQADGWDPTVVTHGSKQLLAWRCPTPGSGHPNFEKRPNQLTSRKNGPDIPWCPACSAETKRPPTLEAFLARARTVHGDRFDYSKVDYQNSWTPVAVGCALHGDFYPSPRNHIHAKSGCPACAGNGPMTLERFVVAAVTVHVDRYSYEDSSVKDGVVTGIRCMSHGPFNQSVSDHLHKAAGCPACGEERTRAAQRLSIEEVLERASAAHQGRYEYSLTSYTNISDRVEIRCPEHGLFTQALANHIYAGQGCPPCSSSLGERAVREALIDLGVPFEEQWTHPTLRAKALLRVDFAVPDRRLLIEFDGKQHSEPVRFGGISQEKAEELFKETQFRDRIKNQWADQNGWLLVRIKSITDIAEVLADATEFLTDRPSAKAA